MKKYGHTKTLFLQNGKYYKWSYKYLHCIKCGNCDHKHKGRGLCTSCWEKQRDVNPRRKEIKARAGKKFSEKNRIPREQWKKFGPKPTGFDQKAYRKEWYQENKPAILLLAKVKRRQMRGLPCLSIMIKREIKYFPFEGLEKPKNVSDPNYNEWYKNNKDYDLLLKYYRKIK